jgi:hypothetical protein
MQNSPVKTNRGLILSDFSIQQKLGEGSFGIIYRARRKDT